MSAAGDRLSNEEIEARLRAIDPRFASAPASRFEAEVARGEAAVPALLEKLEDPDPAVRADAAEALGRIRSPRAAAGLKAALSDPLPPVKQAAAVALAALGDKALLTEFIKALNDPDPKVVIGAATALGACGHKDAVPYLFDAFRTENPAVGAAVARALGRIGAPSAVQWLVAALKNDFVPAEAAEALGGIPDGASLAVLVDALGHARPEVRAAAARSVGKLSRLGKSKFDLDVREKKIVPALKAMLKDPDRKVRLCAALSLAELGVEEGRSAVVQILES